MLPPLLWNILLLIPVAFVLVVPPVAALLSGQDTFPRKFAWAVLWLFFSWFGYFAYYYLSIRRRQLQPGQDSEACN